MSIFASSPALTFSKNRRARNRSPNAMVRVANEIGVGVAALKAFATGAADLNLATLQNLTKVLYPYSELDPESVILRSSNREPPRPAMPDSFDPALATPGGVGRYGVDNIKPVDPSPRRRKNNGSAGSTDFSVANFIG